MKKARRMLIYKEILSLSAIFWVTLTLNKKVLQTAPQMAEIPLAKQVLTRVQLQRPDFANGMKTIHNVLLEQRIHRCNARTLLTG